MKKSGLRFLYSKFIFIFLLLLNVKVSANVYYVSYTNGSDNFTLNEAQIITTPWKTLAKVNLMSANFKPGDSILLNKGDVFQGSLQINNSGTLGSPIVIAAYGNGQLPEISGFILLNGWQQKGGGIWETSIAGGLNYVNTVLVNSVQKNVGRYPNATAPEQGYLHFESANSNISITDSKIANQPNWSGGQVVIRKNRWVLDRNTITSQSGATINYTSQSGYYPDQGYGYFIQNHPSTLDINGEWYYLNGKFGIYTGASSPDTYQIKAGIIETLVSLSNQSNVTFKNIRFSGASSNAFNLSGCQNITVSGCEIVFSGKNAVSANNCGGLNIQNTTILNTGNIACLINNCSNTKLDHNIIRNTGLNPGLGEGDSGSYEGVLISGDNNSITNNSIDSTGYIPLTFSGNNVIIQNNYINHFTLVKDDGGGIYTWNNGANPPTNYNRLVKGNIVLNGIGAPSGTSELTKSYSHGIYMDDNAGQVEISGNTVANCALNGIYIHNAHDINIKQNTVYNNSTQLLMEHDNVAPNSPVYKTSVTGNIFFAKLANQLAAAYKSKDNDIANFGTFDNNFYYRPLDNDLVIGVLQQINGVYSYNNLSVSSWKALYGKDVNSTVSPHNLSAYTVTGTSGSNQFSNGNFDTNINGLYAYAAANNVSTTWAGGALDGGALKVSFSSTSNAANYGSVIIGIGSVTAGSTYRLKFSMLGSNAYKAISTYLRQSAGSYADLSERKSATITANRLEKEYIFTATSSEANASIVFDVPEQTSPIYLDNIQLIKVNASSNNIESLISFFLNFSFGDSSFSVPNLSFDAAGNSYQNNIMLNSFTSLLLVLDTANITIITPTNCSATGSILREEWDNISGNTIADIPLASTISSSSQLTTFEGPTDIGDNYASRIRGYICPPQTGNYTFWIAGDDAAELWLSTDENPSKKVKIASLTSWTGFREWTKFASQKSDGITLQAGKKYYVEALHKEGGGGDNLSVQWQLPDATYETPITGSHLSPYVPLKAQTITFNAISTKRVGDAAFSVVAAASSGLAVDFRIVSGPATITNNIITITASGNVVVEASQPGDNVYEAAPTVIQQFSVMSMANTCAATGTILREQWNNISGNNIADIPVQAAPSSTSQLSSFEGPTSIGDNYASRIRGYICPPQTGNYTFWIAADDAAELWLSTNQDPANKIRIANVVSWTDYREWTKYASQISLPIMLQAGISYYVEALHKQGGGGDNLSIKWQLPDGTIQAPISGNNLSPYVLPATTASINQVVTTLSTNKIGIDTTDALTISVKPELVVFPNPAFAQATINIKLPKTSWCSIAIFNAAGALIEKIYDGNVIANVKTSINLNCNKITDGAYYIYLKSKNYNLTQKINILHK